MITVKLDTTPLSTGHASRGIGGYTRFLQQALLDSNAVQLATAELNNTPDIIHYPFFDLFFASLPLFARKPRVVTIHDVIPLEFPENYKPGKRGTLNFFRQKLALSTVAAIITDSHYSKHEITRRLGVYPGKVFVVPLAPNPSLSPVGKSEVTHLRAQYGLPEEYLLYVGDINYNKNVPQLIKALKYLDDSVHLVLLGKNFIPQEIPEWGWIESQIALSNVAERVHFISDIPSDRPDLLSSFYSGAVAYVQPSLSEGFGLPVLEAMRCRCPVISSNRGSLPEVGDASVLYAEPTAESLAEQVSLLLTWTVRERKKRVVAAEEWQTSFSWRKTAEETIKIYEHVLQK